MEEALKALYGDDAKAIEDEIRKAVWDCIDNSENSFGVSEEVEDILSGYGLEPDYVISFLY